MNVLLISEQTLKSYSSLNDNAWGKNILPAIKTSQDIELQQIIGSCLYNALYEYIQPYLIYITLAHLVTEMSTKLTNFGLVESNDEHLVNLSIEERDLVKTQWTYYADNYCKRMQGFLKSNKDSFPELECGCECGGNIKPCLDSSASSSLWLGGLRRRKLV